MKRFPLKGHRGVLPPTNPNVPWLSNVEPKQPCWCSSCVADRHRAKGTRPMYSSASAIVERFNTESDVRTKAEIAAHETRISRVLVITVEQTGMPHGLSFDHSGDWLREYCLRHNCTYYARPRETFSVREACEQAVRENKNTVIVEDLS